MANTEEDIAVSAAFICAFSATVLATPGIIFWITQSRNIFPPSISRLNIQPDKIIFIHPSTEKETQWCVEEALKCDSVKAVIAEQSDITFTISRRYQLAVEKSKVTAFVINQKKGNESTNACVSRWKVSSLRSQFEDQMPGIAHPRWKVDLKKMRNGRPGSWELEWANGRFKNVSVENAIQQDRWNTHIKHG